MKAAPLALVVAASLGLAACQSDDITRPAADTQMSAVPAGQQDLLTVVAQPALDNVQAGRLAAIRNRPTTAELHVARIAGAPGQLLRGGNVLRLGLAPGLQVVATGQKSVERAADDISWSGPIQGKYGWVQAVMMGGELTATVTRA